MNKFDCCHHCTLKLYSVLNIYISEYIINSEIIFRIYSVCLSHTLDVFNLAISYFTFSISVLVLLLQNQTGVLVIKIKIWFKLKAFNYAQ